MGSRSCQDWLDLLHQYYLKEGGREETWNGDYLKVLKLLPADKPLTAARLDAFIHHWPANTRSRKRACHAAQYLARFAKIDWHPGRKAGKYRAQPVDASKIPSDSEIARVFHSLQNPAWRWVYGAIATYGLRPHEVFRVDLAAFRRDGGPFRVDKHTKTGARLVLPLYPEWFYEFDLHHAQLPPIKLDRPNANIGHSAGEYFSDTARLPFNLYALRHAWARRAYHAGLDDAAAAKMMGHSKALHETTYRAWFDELEIKRAWESMLTNPKRPLPPKT